MDNLNCIKTEEIRYLKYNSTKVEDDLLDIYNEYSVNP